MAIKWILLVIAGAAAMVFIVISMTRPAAISSLFASRTANTAQQGNRTESVEASAIRKAKELLEQSKGQKMDLAQSPCLSQDSGDGWAVDIVHNPRIPADDATSCSSYQNGQVPHIVEITPAGDIVKAE